MPGPDRDCGRERRNGAGDIGFLARCIERDEPGERDVHAPAML